MRCLAAAPLAFRGSVGIAAVWSSENESELHGSLSILETTSANSRAPANSAEATDDLQDRIGRFARFAFIIAGTIFAVARAVDVAELRGLSVKYFDAPDRIAYEVALLVLLVSWRRCRGAPMTPLALHAFDAALTIVLSTCWGMLG
jgi:hypothetical protein